MRSGKFVARSGINGKDILLGGDVKTLAGYSDKPKDEGVPDTLKIINKAAYNKLILYQKYTVFL